MTPNSAPLTAARLGLHVCHTCGLVCRPSPRGQDARCPRCGASTHLRKPDSIGRTWALIVAAYILFIPANVLPVMETGSIFGSQQDTILSGVIFLWTTGSWPLAILVFVASIVVPLMKLMALTVLLLSVQLRSAWRPRERARLYRMLEVVGRWSMLDVYVITLLAALVQLQALAKISAGPGAVAFGAVVVLTMLAAMTFDPRLIWDSAKDGDV